MIALRNMQTPWWLVLSVQFATVATPLAVLPFLSIYLQRLSGARVEDIAIWTAAIAAAPAVCAVASTPVWARLAASYPLGRLLSLSCLVNALSALLQAQSRSVEVFALGRGLQGLTGIGVLLLIAVDHSRASPGKSYCALQQALAAGCMVGPLLGGLAFDHASLPMLLTGWALILAILGVLCALMVRDPVPVADTKKTTAGMARRPAGRMPVLGLAMLLATAGAFGFMPFFAGWALERDKVLFTASVIGFLHAASWAVAILVLPLWGRWIDSRQETAAMRLSTAGSILALLSLLAGPAVAWISVWRVIHGAFSAGLAPSFFSLVGRSKHRIGNLAAGRTAATLGQVIGPAICGLAVSAGGNQAALLTAACLTALGSILLYLPTEAEFHDVE